MRWITARELEQWAKSIGARDALPIIVSDLILASSQDIATIRFPSGDKAQVRGFDGVLVSETPGLNVPQGRSYWEIGTDEDYKAKAKDDFQKRTAEVSPAEQAEITFVLVSPWTWDSSDAKNKLEDWLTKCKANSSWKDVRFIDGCALETWLERRPAVAALHARRTLAVRPQEGVRSTDEYWQDFAGQFNPMLTEEVILCERDEAARQLIQDLLQPSNIVSLAADSPDEVVAFAIAAIRKAPEDARSFLEARTLVVDSIAAGRQFLAEDNLVLLLRDDATRSPRQFSTVRSILVPLGRAQRPGGPTTGATTLGRPSGYALGKAIMSMGLEETRALSLARGSGRSLTVLARLIPGGSIVNPAWINRGFDLVPAILAGAWDTTNSLDRAIIEQIAGGRSCSEIEGRVRALSGDADPPFDLVGPIWKVRAPMDAFVRVGRFISAQDVALLREAMLQVFGQLRSEPDRDAVVSFSSPNPTGYSEWLRDGLATTLLLLAVWSVQADINLGGETGQEFANRVLSEIPDLKADPRVWTSLKDELPLLVEAAPDPLLKALEHMLEGDGALIRPIFNEYEGWLPPAYKHTGVLWALETMAWDPDYFRRAVLALAKLATIDPGVKIGNTPANTLAEIFVLWNPNTNASSTQRLSALNEIAEAYPEVGWKLIITLLPSLHGASGRTAKPTLREAGASDRRPITYRELWENEAAVARLAVGLAGEDQLLWLELVPRIFAFAPVERQIAIERLDQAMSLADPESLKRLWKKLRDEVARHEHFSDAKWALPRDQLAAFQTLVEKYMPSDPITPVAALFDARALDYDFMKGSQERRDALLRLYHDVGPDAVLRLAGSARVPYLVVEAIASAGLTAPQIEDLLSRSMHENPGSSLTVSLSGIFRQMVGAEDAEGWLRSAADHGKLTPEVISTLLQAWPDGRATWSAVRRFGPECVSAYWTRGPPSYLIGTRFALLQRTLMFLRFGRAVEAIQSSLNRLNDVPTELLFRMLDGVIPELNSKAVPVDTMTSYYIEKALEALDGRADAPNEQIAAREYGFLPLLESGSRSLRVHGLMAHDPTFYHRILRDVFKAVNETPEERDDRARARARLSYSLLSHFSTIPGLSTSGIDAQALRSWIDRVRELGQATDRIAVTDSYIGHLLAHSPPDSDGGWPHRRVRDEIERIQSVDLERGVQIERYNMRGVHGKAMFEGGDQERKLSEEYREYAAIAAAWPHTSALLTAIAKGWERDAEREDLAAAQRKLRS